MNPGKAATDFTRGAVGEEQDLTRPSGSPIAESNGILPTGTKALRWNLRELRACA